VAIPSSWFHDEFDLGKSSADCVIGFAEDDYETPISYFYSWYPAMDSELAVGETRYCHLQLALSRRAPPTTSLTFGLPGWYLDPDPANDRQTLFLHKALESIPITPPGTLLVLAGLIATMGAAAQWRHRRCSGRARDAHVPHPDGAFLSGDIRNFIDSWIALLLRRPGLQQRSADCIPAKSAGLDPRRFA
jgi:hypothetical protein